MIGAVVPVKRLSHAKSRLSSRLSPQDRAELVVDLVTRTVTILRQAGVVNRVALATSETTLAGLVGADVLPDGGSLNAALSGAAEWARGIGASALLIVPADLPLLETADVQAVVEAATAPVGVVVAPTGDGGTGALLLQPPDALVPSFGPESYRRHVDAAHRAGVPVRTVTRPGLARELDTVADLEELSGLCR
jgi:2-phospho-L-lactate guanylyltransferase